jgi:serine/threonine protein kinase
MSRVEPGTRLAGRFVVEGQLGEGGMGVVVRARDEILGREVAIKLLPPATVADLGARARLLQEARSTAALEHPGIIRVYDVGETDEGEAYIVMERVKGDSFASLLQRGALSKLDRLRVILEVASALGAAHQAGLVHRDVKPENVMVRDDGRAVVLDFGVVKTLEADSPHATGMAPEAIVQTLVGAIVGTPAYLAPEQALRLPVDARADQFSLAVTAYRAFTGRSPWLATQAAHLFEEVAAREPSPPSSIDPSLPKALDDAIMRALAKSPDDRFGSMTAFAAALEAARADFLPTPNGASIRPPLPPTTNPPTHDPEARTELATAPVPPQAPAPPRRSLWLGIAAGAALIALATPLFLKRTEHLTPPPTESSVPLATPDATVACVPFEVVGAADSEAPSGWLGAATASLACRYARLHLGGELDRALQPAALLELPRAPSSGLSRDVFADAQTRARAARAASERANASITGTVEHKDDRFNVRVVIQSRGGLELAAKSASAKVLHDAVSEAVDGLATGTHLPSRRLAEPEAGFWGAHDPKQVIAFDRFLANLYDDSEEPVQAACMAPNSLGELADLVRIECSLERHPTDRAMTPLPIADGTLGELSRTVRYHVVSGGTEDPKLLAAQLAAARGKTKRPMEIAALAESEAEMWQAAGDLSRARELALLAASTEPAMEIAWGRLMSISLDHESASAVVRAWAAWSPEDPVVWRWLAFGFDGASSSPKERLQFAQRAYLLAPENPSIARAFGDALLETGEREGARAVAAKLLASGRAQHTAGEVLMASVDTSSARFGAAYKRVQQALRATASFGLTSNESALFVLAVKLAIVLGHEAQLADEVIERFVTPEPAPLDRFGQTPVLVAVACALASPDASKGCFVRLRQLVEKQHFLARLESFSSTLDGLERWSKRDYVGAARAFRALQGEGTSLALLGHFMATSFDAAGEHDLAERIDAQEIASSAAWHGATLAHVRAARRAKATNNPARAKELAKVVVEAWIQADESVRFIPEMQALSK